MMNRKIKRNINTMAQRLYLIASMLFILFFSLDRSFWELGVAFICLLLFYSKSSSISLKEHRLEINIYEFQYERMERVEIIQRRKGKVLVITFKERMPLRKTYTLNVQPFEDKLDELLRWLEETKGVPCKK